MRILKLKISLFILVCFLSVRVKAQYNDAGLWTSINLEKKLNKQFSVSVSEEIRMNENVTEIGTFFTDLGVNYKINKIFKIGGYYRFINKRNLDDSYNKRNRFYFDLSCKTKMYLFSLTFRTRFQSQFKETNKSADAGIAENYWRNKLSLKYDLNKKIGFIGSYEIFTPLRSYDKVFKDNQRFNLGLEYTFNKMHSFNLSYMIQNESNVNNPESDYITCIGYNFSF